MKKIYGNFKVDNTLKDDYCVLTLLDGEIQFGDEYNDPYYIKEGLISAHQGMMTDISTYWERDIHGNLFPTEEEISEWNNMIDRYSFYTLEYDHKNDQWKNTEAWILEQEELDAIGWKKR